MFPVVQTDTKLSSPILVCLHKVWHRATPWEEVYYLLNSLILYLDLYMPCEAMAHTTSLLPDHQLLQLYELWCAFLCEPTWWTEKVCVTREYALSSLWVKKESTVYISHLSPTVQRGPSRLHYTCVHVWWSRLVHLRKIWVEPTFFAFIRLKIKKQKDCVYPICALFGGVVILMKSTPRNMNMQWSSSIKNHIAITTRTWATAHTRPTVWGTPRDNGNQNTARKTTEPTGKLE